MRKSILILLMLGTLTAQLCFCNEDNTNQGFIEQQLIELFFENDAAITGCADNRCYLNADKISIDNDKILLVTDSGGKLPLSSLAVDSVGIYTPMSYSSSMLATVYPIMKCKKCGRFFTPTIFNRAKCPYCDYQN